jgi:hypothetical protein
LSPHATNEGKEIVDDDEWVQASTKSSSSSGLFWWDTNNNISKHIKKVGMKRNLYTNYRKPYCMKYNMMV